jgi:hypothetical protein
VTEAEWLTCEDPERMYRVARKEFDYRSPNRARVVRKRTFFGAACCRLVWPLVRREKRSRRMVEYKERPFDWPLMDWREEELTWNAKQAADDESLQATPFLLEAAILVYDSGNPEMVLDYLGRFFVGWRDTRELARQAATILRDVVGNPFRPVAVQAGWLSPTVFSLARQVYDSRDCSALPVLADALEEAGCDSAEVLDHCRGAGPHVHGCWVVHLLLEEGERTLPHLATSLRRPARRSRC